MGIPQSAKLDPECGAATLAVCLRYLALPYDRRRVMAACRVTGEGSTARDLLNACKPLGLTGRVMTADDRGLQALPKPVIAHVERDRFVAVLRADARGIDYACSCCGPWPGGRVELTWKQWHAMEADAYVTVTRPASLADRTLALLESDPRKDRTWLRLAAAGPLASLHVWELEHAATLAAALRGHVVLLTNPTPAMRCGYKWSSPHPLPWEDSPEDDPCVRFGPSQGDPVNLATGEEEYRTPADLAVYNPHGPAVVWRRIYNSLRGPDDAYESDDFGIGWSHPYNLIVHDPSVSMCPQIVADGTAQNLSPTTTDPPAVIPGCDLGSTAGVWDVTLNGVQQATCALPAVWSVQFTPGSPSSPSSCRLRVLPRPQAPSTGRSC